MVYCTSHELPLCSANSFLSVHINDCCACVTDLATRLLSLARNDNLELHKAFQGSLKSDSFEKDGVDADMFLLQAKDIAKEHFNKSNTEHQSQQQQQAQPPAQP
jgi:tRNA nucleotidyltransferase (CCA-adding enzyme)